MNTNLRNLYSAICMRILALASLLCALTSCGSGDKNAEVIINSEEDLISFARKLKSGEFESISGTPVFKVVRLKSDIEITRPFLQIGDGTHPFFGYFDGEGHTIKNMTISADTASIVAMFGFVKDSQIQNVNLENVYMKGASNVGGLCAYGYGSMFMNCTVSGYVEGRKCVGGLLGEANYCTVDDCSFKGTVKGSEYSIGGILGASEYGALVRCYSEGTISGEYDVHEYVGTSSEGLRFENESAADVKCKRMAVNSFDKLSELLFSSL